MEVSASTLEQIYQDIIQSLGYRTTVGPVDKRKVERRRAGEKTALPSARLARAAWRVAALLSPLVPPPTTASLNPQTYNKGSSGQDARYCVTKDDGYRYDSGGREIDGRRSGKFVPGLKPADEMDGREPCDPYNGFPPWPKESYEV